MAKGPRVCLVLMHANDTFTGPVILALVFSGLSFLAAFGALFWQMSQFYMSGGRVRVRLVLGELVPYAGTAAIVTHEPNRPVPRNRWTKRDPKRTLGAGMELAKVVVENRGRLGVSLDGVGLEISGTHRKAYRVTPRIFELEEFGQGEGIRDTFVRLEPYSRVTYWMDFWSIVDAQRNDDVRGTLQLQAYALVAGRTKPATSEVTWNFEEGEVSSRDDPRKISVSDLILREIMRQGWGDEDIRWPLDHGYAEIAARRIRPESTKEEIEAALKSVSERYLIRSDPPPMSYLSFAVHQRLANAPESIEWQYVDEEEPPRQPK